MKPLDGATLEAIAEMICGSGEGHGMHYEAPGPYRTFGAICDFFNHARVNPQSESGTRKWFALESLQAINGTDELERVVLRLASPKEYPGDATTPAAVLAHLNHLLQVEGLEVVLHGVDPILQERTAVAAEPEPSEEPMQPAPDFAQLVQDPDLSDILSFRWEEAQRCIQGEAYLAAVVMMGSILEGLLLYRVELDKATAGGAKCSPKDKGKTKPFRQWTLSSFIDVAHEVGWLPAYKKGFANALRESRNIVHPYVQREIGDCPDRDICLICWHVVRAAVADLLGAP